MNREICLASGTIPEETVSRLKELASRYEVSSFTDTDPSFVLKRYSSPADLECASFISAVLAFGRRDRFIPKIERILQAADRAGGPYAWISSGAFSSFPQEDGADDTDKKFYRFYSYKDMTEVYRRLRTLTGKAGSLGQYMKEAYMQTGEDLLLLLQEAFSGCRAVPQGKSSAAKRLCMFMRWMVRQDSPVDTGLWDWYPASRLIIPLDVHVLQESMAMGLIPEGSQATLKTAMLLTGKMREIWPEDPCRADFALFGLGVSSDAS